MLNADGTGVPLQLTLNAEEERAPAWSPDGTRIAYSCRIGPGAMVPTFEICIMNADGSGQMQLTNTLGINLLASWGELRVKVTGS